MVCELSPVIPVGHLAAGAQADQDAVEPLPLLRGEHAGIQQGVVQKGAEKGVVPAPISVPVGLCLVAEPLDLPQQLPLEDGGLTPLRDPAGPDLAAELFFFHFVIVSSNFLMS